jgi:hypothetical protein
MAMRSKARACTGKRGGRLRWRSALEESRVCRMLTWQGGSIGRARFSSERPLTTAWELDDRAPCIGWHGSAPLWSASRSLAFRIGGHRLTEGSLFRRCCSPWMFGYPVASFGCALTSSGTVVCAPKHEHKVFDLSFHCQQTIVSGLTVNYRASSPFYWKMHESLVHGVGWD